MFPRDESDHSVFNLISLGDSAITAEFGDRIDPQINVRVVAFAKTVANQGWNGIVDIVPTYRSVTVHFDPLHWDSATLIDRLTALPRPGSSERESIETLHSIPVLYGGEWGPELGDVAAFAGLLPTQAINLHASVRYRVYRLGFSPGFPYLGPVSERLAMPRLSTPRPLVRAGTVGIADRKASIPPPPLVAGD